jgi:penicillin-binding protein 2
MESYQRRKQAVRLGRGFVDSINPEEQFYSKNRTYPGASVGVRRILVFMFVIVCILVLATRLFYLTIIQGEYYFALAEGHKTRIEQIQPARGVIYDRNGNVLAENRAVYYSCDKTNTQCNYVPYEEGRKEELQGDSKNLALKFSRFYPEASASAHVVGYMLEIDEETLVSQNKTIRASQSLANSSYCQDCYIPGEYVGVSGLESVFQNMLRGKPGKKLIEVNAFGIPEKELARVEPINGQNLSTSVDMYLQRVMQNALEKANASHGNYGAAAVAMNPKTGEVLAFYSSPSFDPNMFVDREVSNDKKRDVLQNNQKPLFNRVIAGLYPPGSTFKIITAAAGLSEGVVKEDTLVNDTGVISVGPFSFKNWYFTQYGRTEGEINIVKALTRSNDTFFYKLGEWVGIENLEKWAKRFGLAQKTGIELTGEAEGSVKRDRKWYLGDTYHLAIGQGDLQVTPLQVALWTQILANNGNKCRPTLIKTEKGECTDIGLGYDTVRMIKEGLKNACAPGGTGYPLFNFSVNYDSSSSASLRTFPIDGVNFIQKENGGVQIPIACKTGTSQISANEEKTHAWLTAFAPANDPEIVVTVLLEKGGEGSRDAAPVVKEILKEWFSNKRF